MDQNDLPQSFHLLAPVSSSFRAADLHPAPATIPNNWSSELPLVLTGGENSNGSFGEITSGDYNRRLRAQGRPRFRTTLQRDLEAGIVPQGCRVIAVFIPRRDHHDPETDDVAQAMLNFRRIARIVQAIGKPLRQTRLALDLAQQGQSGVRAHVCTVEPEQDRLAIEG